ncbi:hypothetical protein IAU59_004094 [Kwoniella sp. CBS 9459]
MSWKTAHGILTSGPPSSTLPSSSSSSSLPVGQRIKPNSSYQTPHQRETAFARHYGVDKDALAAEERSRKSEWDVVKEHHRFVRDDEEGGATWEERVARSYESKLFKEFALIDLKHYKSKRFALRWRTAPEVVSGIGESTCASLRCKYHQPSQSSSGPAPLTASNLRFRDPAIEAGSSMRSSTRHEDDYHDSRRSEVDMPTLRSFELPFVYAEAGERKETLVKVRLCPSCQRKLKWKPESADKLKSSKSEYKERPRDDRRDKSDDRREIDHHRNREDRRRVKRKGRGSPTSESDSPDGAESEGGRRARTVREDSDRHRHRDKENSRLAERKRDGDWVGNGSIDRIRHRDRTNFRNEDRPGSEKGGEHDEREEMDRGRTRSDDR